MEHVAPDDREEVHAQVKDVARRIALLPPVLRRPDFFENDWIHVGVSAGALTAVCQVDATGERLTVVELLRHC